MLGFDIINNWDTELKEMNKGKVGEQPFHYPNTFLLLLGHEGLFSSAIQTIKEEITQAHARGKVLSILIILQLTEE